MNREAGLPLWLNPGRLLLLCLVAGTLSCGAIAVSVSWWKERELDRALREMDAGRYDQAIGRLEQLAARWPGRPEVEYSLGACAASLGRVDEALTAWARVPRGSPLATRAALGRARMALDHGRLAVAEESLTPLLKEPGEVGEQAARLADQVDLFSGRPRAIGRRIEQRWQMAHDRAGLLRLHWQLDIGPYPVAAVREALDRMAREAPEDDRVWLGQAHLATVTGRYDEADKMLKRCEARRSDDPDVLQARMAWAVGTGRLDDALRVASHLPASCLNPAEAASVNYRLAALRGDATAERAALERWVELAPGDPSAWERLAELASRDGSLDRVASFRKRKAEIDRARDEYRHLMGVAGAGALSGTADLARTAESLGRRFEARGWWTIRVLQAPDDREARASLECLSQAKPASSPAGRTLADLISVSSNAPVRALSSRPATLAVPMFRDLADSAGLRFAYQNDPTMLHRLPETMGGGLGLIDYNGDGWLDVYAVQGGKLPNEPTAPSPKQGDRLFRNKRDGTFEDVTAIAGLITMPGGYGHGVAVGDYDNDGHPDLFITRWRSYALYHNKGDGTFEDATERAGLHGPRDWPTSAAFADLDSDGDLDLYVCHYLDWDPQRSHPCPNPDRPNSYHYCVPRGFDAKADHVFRNDSGRFVDVTLQGGIVDRDGRGLGVVIADLDDDRHPDIFVANDMTANFLFHNLGGFRFEEIGESAGVGSSGEGGYQAGMGIACGDLDGDGRPDLAVTNFYGESTTLFVNLGDGLFADRTAACGLRVSSRYVLGFGAYFLDANNDGLLDLATVNGHVNDYRPVIPYAMPAQLFLGTGSGRVAEVSESAGACWQVPHVGRGMAAGDVDNDGRLDLLFVSEGEPLVYFRNQGPTGHFITLKLEGTEPGSNRDAVGARVMLTSSGRRQVAQRIGGGSFLSASDDRLHFGLGESTGIEAVEVRWPSGHLDRYTDLAVDTAYLLKEGQTYAGPLRGWPRPSAGP
jgi:tetratricopeptide (TPR) repeat protein